MGYREECEKLYLDNKKYKAEIVNAINALVTGMDREVAIKILQSALDGN